MNNNNNSLFRSLAYCATVAAAFPIAIIAFAYVTDIAFNRDEDMAVIVMASIGIILLHVIEYRFHRIRKLRNINLSIRNG